ncbi:MAG: hypothetical protein GY765_32405 [bacterium]|nr:hypothetical protein [bacterium]
MRELYKLIGEEQQSRKISNALCEQAKQWNTAMIGAMQITCSDETEHECTTSFQRSFVQYLLPEIKFGHQAPFRIANPGGRYELGTIPIMEAHFKIPAGQSGFKLMVVKINSHVGVSKKGATESYGLIKRYGTDSTCCGALTAMMDDLKAPYIDELRESFRFLGMDRLAVLKDKQKVDPRYQPLFTAIVSAKLQAQRVVKDILEHPPLDPVIYLVANCVSLNREERDTEILCGITKIDYRTSRWEKETVGLSDDPSTYSIDLKNRRLLVNDSKKGEGKKEL